MKRSGSTNQDYQSDIIDMSVTIPPKGRRERAVLCAPAFKPGVEAQWFPLSLVEIADNGDGTHTLTAPEWKLRQAGFL